MPRALTLIAALVAVAACDSSAPLSPDPEPEPEPEPVFAEGSYTASWTANNVRWTLDVNGVDTAEDGALVVPRNWGALTSEVNGQPSLSAGPFLGGSQAVGDDGEVLFEFRASTAQGQVFSFEGAVAEDGESISGTVDGRGHVRGGGSAYLGPTETTFRRP